MAATQQKPSIRLLTQNDAQAYRELRLIVLQSNPNSFLSSYEFEVDQPEHFFRYTVLDNFNPPHFGYFGYFIDEKMVGYIQLTQNFEKKMAHTGQVFNLSVHPEFRKNGIGKALMLSVIQQASEAELEVLYLSCLSSNIEAKKLYESQGFILCGEKPKATKWQDQYQDELIYYKLIDNQTL